MLQSVRLATGAAEATPTSDQAACVGGRGRRRSASRRSSRRTSSWTILAGRCATGRGTTYRCRCISFSFLIEEGTTGGAVGAESRRSLHLVVCLVPYAMSRDGCRPLPRAAADSNRPSLGPSSTQARSTVAWCAALRAAAALVHAPRRLSAPTALSRRASSPSSPPAERRRARGARARARPPCGGAGRRRRLPSA